MTEQLKQDAIALLEEVEANARATAQKEDKAIYDAKLSKLEAAHQQALQAAREQSYKEGYAAKETEVAAGQQEPAPTENLVLSDGDAYTRNNARLVASFSYSRKFANTKWGTLILPVALDYDDWCSKFEIAEIVGVTVGSSITAVRQVLGPGSQTFPNHPYQIRAKSANSSKAQTITSRNCQVFPAEPGHIDIVKAGKTYRFRGIYTTMSAADLKGKYYSSGGHFVPATSLCKPMRVILEISE